MTTRKKWIWYDDDKDVFEEAGERCESDQLPRSG